MNRREVLRLFAAFVASGTATLALAGPRVLAVRAWPGKTSTRITIESDSELRFFVTSLAYPDRTVVDISDVQADAAFQKALETLKNDTGVLARARIGQFRPDTARLVLELKSRAETAAFALPPVGQYRHRLVIDLTPADADDPIAEFLAKLAERESTLERTAAEIALPSPKPEAVKPVAPPPVAAVRLRSSQNFLRASGLIAMKPSPLRELAMRTTSDVARATSSALSPAISPNRTILGRPELLPTARLDLVA